MLDPQIVRHDQCRNAAALLGLLADASPVAPEKAVNCKMAHAVAEDVNVHTGLAGCGTPHLNSQSRSQALASPGIPLFEGRRQPTKNDALVSPGYL
jgi:hypothetical protein